MSDSSRRDFLKTAAVTATALTASDAPAADPPADLVIPEWVHNVTRMAFLSPGEVDRAAKAGAQVVHTNVVWPYFPLRKDGGGLSNDDGRKLRELGARGQVLCVTHLAQVASQAHHQHRVAKLSDGRTSRTSVHKLGDAERVEELARMLGGVAITRKARDHAREMLKAAGSG